MRKVVLFLIAAVGLMTACVNDELRESGVTHEIAGLDAQVEAVKGSAEDLKTLNEALGECGLDVNEASEAIAEQLAYLKDCASLEEGALASLEQQKVIASVVGAVEATAVSENVYSNSLEELFEALHTSVSLWLGESFSAYYPIVLAQAKVAALDLAQQFEDQQLYVDALISDVAAGLRKDENPQELIAFAGSVQRSMEQSEELVANLASMAAEVEKEYKDAIQAMASDSAFDGDALAEFNSSVLTKADDAEATLMKLAADVTKCKEDLAELQERLTLVEGAVDELLGMIQSVTFLPLHGENAAAYYQMDVNNKVSDSNLPYFGKAQRTPVGEMELNYIVSPAAASTVLNANLDAVSVFGYYADRISTMAVNPSDYIDFEVTKVVATDANRGLVTVTVKHALKDDFYFKEVGAKCALSVKTGKTDLTSKFVEIVPVDNSTTVYVTGITLSETSFEIDKGETKTLSAVVTPSNATNAAYTWTSSNSNIVEVNANTGAINAVGVGEAILIATTRGVDEWGLPLSAQCKVKVNEAFRLSGPPYVEMGYDADLFLDYPSSAIVKTKEWSSSDESKLTVDQNGKVTGVAHTYNIYTKKYNSVTVSCIINGVTTLSWDMLVAAVQPNEIITPALSNGQNEISMRVDESISLASTISPTNVPDGAYRITYESDHGLGWINFDSGVINSSKNTMSPTTAYVDITVKNVERETYLVKGELVKKVIVKVLPYYVKSISFDPVEMQLGQTVTLSPKFTADVDGKEPTNTELTWSSSNEAIATVDQHGVVTSVAAGTVTITATATDGSGVSGACVVNVTQPWKSFEIGDYVVRTSSGDVDFASDLNTAKSKGSVVGVVVAKTNPRATDSMLPSSCTHGLAVALGEGSGMWWSDAPSSSPYKVYEWATQNGYQSTMGVDWSNAMGTHRAGNGDKFVGYNNTLALKAFITARGLSSEMINALNAYQGPALPNGASSYYLPSVAEMDAIAAVSNMSWALSNKLSDAGGVKFTNEPYWTVSDSGNSSSNAAKINPLTGALDGAGMKKNAARFRYVFAF